MNNNLNVLLIEDNPRDARLIQEMLAEDSSATFSVAWANRLAAGLEQLAASDADVVLLDLSLPDSQGLETFAQVQAQAPHMPLLVLSGLDDEALAVQAVRQGAQDYLVKGRVDSHLLARAIRYAVARKQAEETLAWEAGVNAAIADLARALISPTSIDDLSFLVLEHGKRLTSSAFGYVGYIDPQTGALVSSTLTRDIWDICQVADKDVVFHKFSGLWGWVLEHRRPLLTNDPTRDPRSVDTPPGHVPIQRFLAAPALLGDELVGQIALANPGRDYTERDLALVERLALLYALAVQRRRKEAELQRYANEQAALYAVTSAVTAFLDPRDLLSAVLDVVLPLVGTEVGWVTLPGATLNDPPVIVAWRGVSETFVQAEASLPLRDCAVCAPLLTDDAKYVEPTLLAGCPRLPPEVLAGVGLHHHIGVPLSVGRRVLGILNVAWRTPRPDLNPDPALLRTIGRQVGLALRNAQLYQEARQVDRLQVLNRLDQALAATLDPATVAEVTLRQIAAALHAPASALLLLSPYADVDSGQVLTLTDGWSHITTSVREDLRGQPLWQQLCERRESVLLSSADLIHSGVGELHRPLIEQGGAPGLVVPIHGEGPEAIALLMLGGRPPDRPFTDEDRALAQAAAGRAGQAIQNARLYRDAQARADENAHLYDELKTLLREREQAQAQLIHSEKMSALGRLVSSIAHEINNPLQSMQGCLTLTMEELAGRQRREKIERYLGIVEDEIERVSAIVRRMRDFYRPVRGGFQPTDLHEVIDSVLALSDKQLQHSHVVIEREWAESLPLIQATPDHLKQVFLNLVLNAIDAMPRGGVLRVRTALGQVQSRDDPQPQPAVRVEFSDTGVGMSSEELSRVFEPFFTTKENGSGLGLSVSYGIIEAHHGRITVASQVGAGTRFTIWLPVAQPE